MPRGSLLRRLTRRLWVAAYAQRLRRALDRATSVDELVGVVSTCRLGPLHIRPMQIAEELFELLELVSENPPRTVLEIGTARGGTLCLLTRLASPDSLVISVDLPDGPYGGGYPSWKSPLYRSFANPGQQVELIRGDSAAPQTRDRVARCLGDRSLDFLLIDGDHSYQGVRRDFEAYAPLLHPGGMVALHDVQPGPRERVGGVPHFWREIREHHRHREILATGDHPGFGLGVLWIDDPSAASTTLPPRSDGSGDVGGDVRAESSTDLLAALDPGPPVKVPMLNRGLYRLTRWAHKLGIHRLALYESLAERLKGRVFATTPALGRHGSLDLEGAQLLIPYSLVRQYIFRPFEPETTERIRSLLRPGGTFVDVGANIGYHTVLAAQRVGANGRVLAIEPAPDNLRYLSANVQANTLEHVRVVPCAIGGETRKRTLHLRSAGLVHSFYPQGIPVEEEIAVDQIRLDELIDGPVDLVKIDVEGAEPEVLAGMVGLLSRARPPRLIVEWNPQALRAAGYAENAVPRILLERGFHIELLDVPSRELTVDEALRCSKELPPSWYANILATGGAT